MSSHRLSQLGLFKPSKGTSSRGFSKEGHEESAHHESVLHRRTAPERIFESDAGSMGSSTVRTKGVRGPENRKGVIKMQVRVETLREALELVRPVVPRKATLESTRYVLLRDGKAVATDLDVAVELEVPGFEGEVLIPHKDALEALKRIPATELLTITVEGKSLVLCWSRGKASF